MEKIEKEYSELEKKVIKKGLKQFREELKEASKPIMEVLKKYRLSPHYGKGETKDFIDKIKLRGAYDSSEHDQYPLLIPNDKELTYLHPILIEMFLKEIEEIKEKIGELPI